MAAIAMPTCSVSAAAHLASTSAVSFRRPCAPAAMLCARAALAANLSSLAVSLRRLRLSELGRAHVARGIRGGRGGGCVMSRAVWKQEVLWAEAPVVDVGIECDEHYHFVLDISGNKELMEGHTKPGQFVQVSLF